MNTVKGHLEILDKGFGFLRRIDDNFRPLPTDAFVPTPLIATYKLREGIYIEGTGVKGSAKSTNLKLDRIDTINGRSFEAYADTIPLQQQTSINPTQRFIMTRSGKDLTGKALDRIVPMGRGQRGLIIAPPKTGKTTILKHMANAVTEGYADAEVFVLLVDERPEEVTDFKRGVEGAHVLASSADQSIAQHMRMTRLAMHCAIRCAEAGRDTVVFIDSLTRMARAFNTEARSHGRTMTGGLAANALEIPRQVFGAARKIEDGGSLTIVATILVETGSRMDDIIYQEFKGTGNMDLVLNRDCAEQRLWPAIDINQSGTRKEELLMDNEAYQESIQLRRALSGFKPVDALGTLLEHLNQQTT